MFYGFYMLVVFVAILVAMAGIEETLKIFAYVDLQLRYASIRLQMKWMGWKLKRQLVKETNNFEKFLKEYKNDR